MTESEWRMAASPESMMLFLRGKVSNRKLRLFACACCLHLMSLVEDARSSFDGSELGSRFRNAIEVAERFADGHAKETDLERARGELASEYRDLWAEAVGDEPDMLIVGDENLAIERDLAAAIHLLCNGGLNGVEAEDEFDRADLIAAAISDVSALANGYGDDADKTELRQQAAFLRDIANPYRRTASNPTFLTATVLRIAESIYLGMTFDRFPILADALEEAGCMDREILEHLRTPATHWRGCWALDEVLGKE